ncbi:MAG: phytoene desaturase family protein [Weeksellaceae bacterium]
MKKKIVVVGGGFGGLASAALLGKQGYDVTLLEKNEAVGGRASVLKKKGFTFDMGPSWYLMPDVFDRFYGLFDAKPSDFLKLKRLDPNYRVFFGTNDYADIKAKFEDNLPFFEKIDPGVTPHLKSYLKQSQENYEVSKRFIYHQYDSVFDFFNKDLINEKPDIRLFGRLDKYLARYIKNERLQKILAYSMVFLGGSPSNTPGLFSIMSHIDFNLGVYYPMGGIYEVIRSLQTLCDRYGVKILTNQNVKKINVDNGTATTVITDKKSFVADEVVVNADYQFAETQLLDPQWQTYNKSFWSKRTVAPSAFIMYLGVKRKVQNLKHHTLLFDHDWEQHFNEIFDNPMWPENPSYYVCCPSKTDSSVAPKGMENLFILVPIASGLKDTAAMRKKYGNKMLAHLTGILGDDFRKDIVVQETFGISDFEERYNAYKGTALGLTQTFFQSTIFRPRNKSKKVNNLYYTGQYTIPGIGMPMCLVSAELVVDKIVNG